MAFKITRDSDSTEMRNSRYVQGGLTDIYNNRLGWWQKRVLSKQDDDSIFAILDNEKARPDLISQRAYGKPTYAWLVMQYNDIIDPEVELIPGKIIRLPTQARLILDIITKPEGGKPIT